MTKKLFVVLVVVTALLISFSLLFAAKNAPVKGVPDKFVKQTLSIRQNATSMPVQHMSTLQSAEPIVAGYGSADRAFTDVYSIASPGDILWHCNVMNYNPPDSDYQCLGVQTLRDTIYVTGGSNGTDPNYIYVWIRTGGTCQYLYKVPQPSPSSGWGWRDMAADGQYLYAAGTTTLYCFYVTPGGVVQVPANNITFTPVGTIRAVAYDPVHNWFWTANFASSIYAFNRSGVQQAMYSNTYALYGMAFDTLSTPGQPWLWTYSQDSSKVRQFNPNTGAYTGVVYSAYGEGGNGVGIAGGLCMLEGNMSKPTATLLGLLQGTPADEIWAMEIAGAGPVGCCQLTGYCDMMTEAACLAAGGTWNADPNVQCIGTTCQLPPPDSTCHLQWDDGGAAYYFSSWNVGDQQAIYYNPGTMCTDCPQPYPFKLTSVTGIFYDFAGSGSVDVIFHIYDAPADTCTGPGAEIYSFPVTVTSFYPNEATVPIPELLCLTDDFFLAVEYNSGTTGSIPCLLMDATADPTRCIMFNWYGVNSPPWIEWWDFFSPPPPGEMMLRADGICNAGACSPGVECNLIQDNGSPAYYFGALNVGDKLAKFFDPEVYCDPPVYPYRIHDVDILLYDFAGVGTVDLQIGVNLMCQNPCDGPGTQVYLSEPITVTDFYPTMAHIVLPDVVCIYEPFYITVVWASGVTGSIPSFLMEGSSYPCDTCHAWLWYDGYSPPWWEWSDFWAPPVPGCPIVRVSGFTESPACDVPPCDTTLEILAGGPAPTYVWRNPSRYGDRYLNERFEMPASHGGLLEKFDIYFYLSGTTGTPDPDFYIWLSDGIYPLDNNPPYQAIATFHLDYSSLAWYPNGNTIQTYSHGIIFDPGEKFHIGYAPSGYPAGDTLRCLSDDGSANSTRSIEWALPGQWGTMLDDWGYGIDFLIDAYICPFAPVESTFTMTCTPAIGYAVPNDPPTHIYDVAITSVLGYNLPVDLSMIVTPPDPNITAVFTPDLVPPSFTSAVDITVGPTVAYGNYTLTFQAVGSDNQTKTCDVTLIVQPPYDEGNVNFFHGTQKVSNFGAIANDAATDNFLWYGTNYLFDGSFLSATTDDAHMALDVYNCTHVGFIPSQHLVITHQPWCAGTSYEENYGEVAYANFYTEEDVISCEWDSLFVIGLSDVTSTDFSIKIKIYYNPTPTPIPQLNIGLYEDWDIGDAYNNFGDMDIQHNIIYQYDPIDPNLVFGMFKAPFYNDPMFNMWLVPNPYYVWPGQGFCGSPWLLDELYTLMTTPGYGIAAWPGGPPAPVDTDYSLLMCPPPFSLNPGEKHIEVWFDFGRNMLDGFTWSQWSHKLLRYAGFYRGDVDASDTLELPSLDVSDLVYLINYLYKGGPAPLPFADQGDVDAKGPYGSSVCDNLDLFCPKENVDINDVLYLINYVFKHGPPPVDRIRFIEQCWTRPSLFTEPLWQ